MARKTPEEARQTYDAILDAAEAVFCERGVSQASLCDIASAAGVTRGAIYGHFRNKVDVFSRMYERVHLPIERLAEAGADSQAPDPLGRLRSLLIKELQDTAADPRQRRVLEILYHKCEMTPELGALVQRQQALRTRALGHTRRFLGNAVACGQLPAGLDCERAAVGVHAYVTGLIANWLFDPASFDLGAEAEPLVGWYLAALQEGGGTTPGSRHR
ncbi:MAG: TetR family transcriptional regulator [Halorhodospira sp.]